MRTNANREASRQLLAAVGRGDARRESLLLDQDLVERRGPPFRQHVGEEIQRVGVRVKERHGGPRQRELGQPGEVVLVEETVGLGESHRGRLGHRRGPARRDLPEVLLDPRLRLRYVEIAGNDKRGVVGPIPAGMKLPRVGQGGGVQIGE